MTNFRTEVETGKAKFIINPNDPVVLIGSCFADNIGELFHQHRFKTLSNPYGVLYNPLSVADALESIIEKRVFQASDLFYDGQLYHSDFHHGSFSHPNQQIAINNINKAVENAHTFLLTSKTLFITLGTAWVYKNRSTNQIVANCHKQNSSLFECLRLEPSQITNRLETLIDSLQKINPSLNIVFTVSPVRHLKDSAHGNQISKAILLLAIENLVQIHPTVDYFGAYELMLDDLRDYRFYNDDMIHPSSEAVNYIWEKLKLFCFSNQSLSFSKQTHQLNKDINHRPLHPNTPAYTAFLNKVLQKICDIENNYENIDLNLDKIRIKAVIAKINEMI